MTYKHKHPKALWTKTYPDQAKKLRPESTERGGIKARSQPEALRMAVYRGIKELFITQNPLCQCCQKIYTHVTGGICAHVDFADSVHHKRGRSGLLLFDVRYWLSACDRCHRWIHEHPSEAIRLGLLSKDWNKQE